ncbi:MAG: efflux RND transporter permease subunit [Chloroherpetonaceae bacterium]|nr:efflux RND transporter permease subunit [Chloroherpetonaceae bacterium]
MHIAELCVRRPIATMMFFTAALIVGVICFQKLSVNFLPDISTPRLTIRTAYKNASPDEMMRLITIPIEETMNTLTGVKNIRSLSREGVSFVQVDFYWGTDMNYAFIDAREKLDRLKAQLPKEAERPTILRIDPASEPIMMLVISPKRDSLKEPTQRELSQVAEVAQALIKRRLEQLEGVAQASVLGMPTREIRIVLNAEAINSLGLNISDIARNLASQNIILSGGSIRQGNFRLPLRLSGELRSPSDIASAIVHRTKDGRPILLKDIATVSDDFAEPRGITLFNGVETIQIAIRKESAANTVETAKRVIRVLEELRQELPTYAIEVVADQSVFIQRSIDDIINAIYIGALLAFLVLFFFLNELRYSLVIAITTPVAIVLTFIFLYAFGVTLNIISLTGIAVGIGMLGDNAIIVVENVSRLRDEGMEWTKAIVEGVKEINVAAAASTFTNVAIFLPVIFTDGIAREIFRDMGLAMTFSLLSSLIIAITLVPALLRIGLDRISLSQRYPLLMRYSTSILNKRLEIQMRWVIRYEKFLKWVLLNRHFVVVLSFLILIGTTFLGTLIPAEIVPKLAQKELRILLSFPSGYDVHTMKKVAIALTDKFLSEPDVHAVLSQVGQVSENQEIFSLNESNNMQAAVLDVSLSENANESLAISRLRTLLEAMSKQSGFQFSIQRKQTTLERIFRPEKDDFKIKLIGNNISELYQIVPSIQALVSTIEGVKDVRTGLEKTEREIYLSLRRDELSRYGIEPSTVERFIESATKGFSATTIQDAAEKISLTLYVQNEQAKALEELLTKRVKTPSGDIELRMLVQVESHLFYAERFRENGKNQIVLKANASEGYSATSVAETIDRRLKGAGILPAGIRVEIGGENEEVKSSFKSLLIILLLSLLLVYMILAAEFESLLYPLVIMLTSPLAAVGAILLMLLVGESYNALSLIGLVIMVGAVDNDAVIATDFIVELRRNGYAQSDAIFLGVSKRLRSIVMTTVTTVVGVIPLLFNVGSGSELGASLSTPLVGGLLASTAFTLVTIPAVFTYLDREPKKKKALAL